MYPTSVGPPSGVQSQRPGRILPTAPQVLRPEYLVTSQAVKCPLI